MDRFPSTLLAQVADKLSKISDLSVHKDIETEIQKADLDNLDKTNQVIQQLNATSAAAIPWTSDVAYTPTFTGFGTAASVSFFYHTIGGWCWVVGKFTGGTSTAVEARVSLPGSFVTDNSGLIPSVMTMPGIWNNASASFGAASETPIILVTANKGYITFGATGAGAGLTTINGNNLLAAGQIMTMWFAVPVQ